MVSITQRNFAGGELPESLYGRGDLERYQLCLKRCKNVIPTSQGLLVKRAGMEYLDKSSATSLHFVPFVFSNDQSYLLVIESGTTGWAHPYYRGEKITQAAPAAYNVATTYYRGQYCLYGGKVYQALRTTVGDDPSYGGLDWEEYAYCRVPVSFSATYLPRLKYAQSGDVLVLTNTGSAPQQINRLAHDNWTAEGSLGYLWIDFNPDTYTVTNFAVTVGQADDDEWHIGRNWTWEIRVVYRYGPNEWIEQSVGATVSATAVCAIDRKGCALTWQAPAGLTGAADHYYRIYRGRDGVLGLLGEREGGTGSLGWVDTGTEPTWADGPMEPLDEDSGIFNSGTHYPAAVAYYEGRRVFGGTDAVPAGVWASNNNTYRQFMQQPFGEGLATDGIAVRLGARGFEEVRALVPSRKLVALTSAAEWHVGPPVGTGLTRSNASTRAVTHFGCSYLPPLAIGDAIIFVDRTGNTVRELRFDDNDGHGSRDLSALARHLLDGYEIVDWAYQTTPEPIIWLVRDDGVLLSLTYAPGGEVVAWAQHTTEGTVENVCVVPEGTTEVVYLCVLRSIVDGDATVTPTRLIECMRLTTALLPDERTAEHLDCATWGWDGRPSEHSTWPQTLRPTSEVGSTVLCAATGVFANVLADWAASDLGTGNTKTRFVLSHPTAPSTADLVLQVSSIDADTLTCTVVSGTVSAYLNATCKYEVQKTHIHGLTRFEGDYSTNGLPLLPYWYADAVPSAAAESVTSGVSDFGDHRTLLGYGLPFSAEIELLDALEGSESGTCKKQLRSLEWETKTCGRPAMGDSLESLTDAENTSVVTYAYERATHHAIPSARFADEATGALKQTVPFPLHVFRAIREVEFSGT